MHKLGGNNQLGGFPGAFFNSAYHFLVDSFDVGPNDLPITKPIPFVNNVLSASVNSDMKNSDFTVFFETDTCDFQLRNLKINFCDF